jgi:hypothetical protein
MKNNIPSDGLVDYSVFQKTPEEKRRLKAAKLGKSHRNRPPKEERHRLWLEKQQQK